MEEIPNSHLGNVNCPEDSMLWLLQSFKWLRLTINVVDFEEEFDFLMPGNPYFALSFTETNNERDS